MKILFLKHRDYLCEECCSGERLDNFSPFIYQNAAYFSRKGFDTTVQEYNCIDDVPLGFDILVFFMPVFKVGIDALEFLKQIQSKFKEIILCPFAPKEIQKNLGFEVLSNPEFKRIKYTVYSPNRFSVLERLFSVLISNQSIEILRKINDISFRDNGKVFYGGDSSEQLPVFNNENFSAIELYSKIDFSKYKYLNYPLAYGCVSGCAYCVHAKPLRIETDLAVVKEELVFLMDKFDEVIFLDCDIFTNQSFAKDFCYFLIEINNSTPWCTDIRTHKNYDSAIYALMNRAGCNCLVTGVETLNLDLAKKLHKKINMASLYDFCKKCYSNNIEPMFNFIIGFYENTENDYIEIKNFMLRFPGKYAVQFLSPIPGTSIHDKYLQEDIIQLKNDFYKDYIVGIYKPVVDNQNMNSERSLFWGNTLKKTATYSYLSYLSLMRIIRDNPFIAELICYDRDTLVEYIDRLFNRYNMDEFAFYGISFIGKLLYAIFQSAGRGACFFVESDVKEEMVYSNKPVYTFNDAISNKLFDEIDTVFFTFLDSTGDVKKRFKDNSPNLRIFTLSDFQEIGD